MAKKKLDPRKPKLVAQIGPFEAAPKVTVEFSGQWRASGSSQHPWVGPGGHATKKLKKRPKWCVLVYAAIGGGPWVLIGHGKGPFVIRRNPAGMVHVMAVMNDDMFTDNQTHPTNPMTADSKYF